MRVALFYRSLTRGGTERQIVALAQGLARRGHSVSIVTFYDDNPLGEGLAAAGVALVTLGKKGRWDTVGFGIRFLSAIRRLRPQVLYSFLPTANLVALVARLAMPRLPIVWGVRTSFLDLSRYEWMTRLSYGLEARASRLANAVIANSHAGLDYLAVRGFTNGRMTVVPNGIDTDRFRPDAEARMRIRAEWAIAPEAILVGTVARLDPEKGIPQFLEAAASLARNDSGIRFAAIGGGEPAYRDVLVALADRLGLGGRLLWTGPRGDMPSVYAALDLLVLSSPNEGTSNVVLEAMACGVSVVASDVGDNARAIGESGLTVPFGQTEALASAMRRQLDRRNGEGAALAETCRQRIRTDYSLEAMVESTEAILQSLAVRA
jgi:glycosyltransferase involved in cell wall biosynthesis